jgi:hypothetical protein
MENTECPEQSLLACPVRDIPPGNLCGNQQFFLPDLHTRATRANFRNRVKKRSSFSAVGGADTDPD